MMYSETEMKRIHKQFQHQQNENLYAVMQRADPEVVASSV